jgi:hypothetical protein
LFKLLSLYSGFQLFSSSQQMALQTFPEEKQRCDEEDAKARLVASVYLATDDEGLCTKVVLICLFYHFYM